MNVDGRVDIPRLLVFHTYFIPSSASLHLKCYFHSRNKQPFKKNVAPSFWALKEQDISWHEKDIDLKYRL